MYHIVHSSKKKEHNLSFFKCHFILTVFQKNILSLQHEHCSTDIAKARKTFTASLKTLYMS